MEEGDYDDADKPLVIIYNLTDIPERFHWKNGPFMSEIVLITRPGITIWTVQFYMTSFEKNIQI